MVSVSLSQVSLISKRMEVVAFFEKLLGNKCPVRVYPNVNLFIGSVLQNGQNINSVAIVDVLAIASSDEVDFFINEKYISLQKVFFIESIQSNFKVFHESENLKLNIIPFPCDYIVAMNQLSQFVFSGSVTEKSEKVSENLPSTLGCFAGTSFSTKSLRDNFYTFGKTDLPLIIEGESGTGKTLAAELIHSISLRKSKRFRRINMPCIQPEIAEAELFGSVSGAFTGAKDKKGILQELDGGTVLFDEVSEIPLPVQAKLLKFLDSGCFCRVGSTKETYSDVRIISATNVNLEERVRRGLFRRDFYERLKGKVISIPSLNSRKEDIDALVKNFLLENGFDSIVFTKEAIDVLKEKNWTGNVRELEYCLALTCSVRGENKKIIGPEDLIFAS